MTVTTEARRTAPRRRPMNAWRLEWLRLTRSPRGIALILVYVFFGLVGPLLAKYMEQVAKYASSDVTIVAPAPEPRHGIINFVSQGSQTGMIVLIVIAAGVLSFDARRGLATFYRTRASGAFALIWPRFVATAVLAVGAYALGTAAAWFETTLVLGRLPARQVLSGVVLETVFLVFAVAVVTAASSFGRSTLSTVGISLVVLLLALPVAGIVKTVAAWLPTRLLTAPAALVTDLDATLGDYLRPVVVSAMATVVLIALAVHRLGRREL
jgi:ABC-2 type transport system permease protein